MSDTNQVTEYLTEYTSRLCVADTTKSRDCFFSMNANELIDNIFPVKIYTNDYYYPFNLSMTEKFYLAIFQKCNDITKTDIIMQTQLSKVTVNRIKKKLENLKLLDTQEFDANSAKEFTIKNSHKGLKCEWCGKESYVLQQHHYPIPRSKGGTETVNICPNCHYTYHSLIKE